jgi:TPR repeat protein
MLESGRGVPRDTASAENYLARACEGGVDCACPEPEPEPAIPPPHVTTVAEPAATATARAAAPAAPSGPTPEELRALRASTEAACLEQYDYEACARLGVMFLEGTGGPPDRDRALALLEQACIDRVRWACRKHRQAVRAR